MNFVLQGCICVINLLSIINHIVEFSILNFSFSINKNEFIFEKIILDYSIAVQNPESIIQNFSPCFSPSPQKRFKN